MRRNIGEDHRTAALFSEQFDWWLWLMNWQQTGHQIAVSAVFLSRIMANCTWRGFTPDVGLELGPPNSLWVQTGDCEQ